MVKKPNREHIKQIAKRNKKIQIEKFSIVKKSAKNKFKVKQFTSMNKLERKLALIDTNITPNMAKKLLKMKSLDVFNFHQLTKDQEILLLQSASDSERKNDLAHK